jgi:type II secretory pathway pseudopilin PulG
LLVIFKFPQNKKVKGEKQMKKGSSNKRLIKNDASSKGSKNKGITLIALVISIIVILILAGVSLSATVGDNGVITKAQQAKLAQEEAQRQEELEYILFEYNSAEVLGEVTLMTRYLYDKKQDGTLQAYLWDDENDVFLIEYKNNWYSLKQEGDYYKINEKLNDDLTQSGSVAGSYIVTVDNVNSVDGITFSSGSSYIVLENIEAENFNFFIPAGDPVTIKLMGDMTIDNSNYAGRSAIDLEEGATLNLYIYGNVVVNSSLGLDAEQANGAPGTPGSGGSAGIHVPSTTTYDDLGVAHTTYATLNIYGTGNLTCMAGDAGDGSDAMTGNIGGSGGGGAGAGIGGNGGAGGYGCCKSSATINSYNIHGQERRRLWRGEYI